MTVHALDDETLRSSITYRADSQSWIQRFTTRRLAPAELTADLRAAGLRAAPPLTGSWIEVALPSS
jgi:hypothetical protein